MRYRNQDRNSGPSDAGTPPVLAQRLARLLCHPDFVEEIEGDLAEKFESDVRDRGLKSARRKYWHHVLSLVKLNIMFNLNHHTMTQKDWIQFIALSAIVVVAAFVPFLPGPYSAYFIGISGLAQMIGFFGLIVIPIGVIWLVLEIRNARVREKLTLWTNGYILSWVAFVVSFGFLGLLLGVVIDDMGWVFNIPSILFVAVLFVIFVRKIQRLRSKTEYRFNSAPLYLVALPLLAFCTRVYFVEKVADISRETAINNSAPIIAALEKYRSDHTTYPTSLAELKGDYLTDIPASNIMGIRAYRYEGRGDNYELSFVQWLHWGATEERVIYTAQGHENYKGHFASFDTSHPGWRYYWRD